MPAAEDYSVVTVTTLRTEQGVGWVTQPGDARRLRYLPPGPVLRTNLHRDAVTLLIQ